MSSSDKQLDKSTSVTNSLLPDSSSCSGTTSSSSSSSSNTRWNKTGYGSSFSSDRAMRRHNDSNNDDLSSLSGSSMSNEELLYGGHGGAGGDGFEVELLSSEPEDFDESGHLFHMDLMKHSLSDISLQSVESRTRICSAKLPRSSQNLSFSRDRVREIERHNQILLQKIMTSKPTLKTKPRVRPDLVNTPAANNSRITSAAVNRKKKQRQIEIDNQLLRKKLEKIERSRRSVL